MPSSPGGENHAQGKPHRRTLRVLSACELTPGPHAVHHHTHQNHNNRPNPKDKRSKCDRATITSSLPLSHTRTHTHTHHTHFVSIGEHEEATWLMSTSKGLRGGECKKVTEMSSFPPRLYHHQHDATRRSSSSSSGFCHGRLGLLCSMDEPQGRDEKKRKETERKHVGGAPFLVHTRCPHLSQNRKISASSTALH